MTTFLLLTVLGFGVESHSAKPGSEEAPAPAAKAQPGDADVRRLVEQLGRESYPLREEATRKLAALGEKAANALKAARISPDPEVRRRAVRLLLPLEARVRKREIEALQRRFEDIKTSNLSSEEKVHPQKELFKPGMTAKEIELILDAHTWGDNPLAGYGGVRQYGRHRFHFWFDPGLRLTCVKVPAPSR